VEIGHLYELSMPELATREYMKSWKEVEVQIHPFLISELHKCDWVRLCGDVNIEFREYLISAPDGDDPASIPNRNRLSTSIKK
jgi:hypothetical protein